jgi:tRNA threonylcarbamoyladenosine biosynthesis protein TsaE
MTLTYKLSEIEDIAAQLIDLFTFKTILFEAEMGSGKTTLIKALGKHLGVKDITGSPTFSLVNEYEGKKDKVYHFDLYRIEDEEELYDIGFEDYLTDNAYIFIEWPEKASNFLEEHVHTIKLLAINSDTRELTLQ